MRWLELLFRHFSPFKPDDTIKEERLRDLERRVEMLGASVGVHETERRKPHAEPRREGRRADYPTT